LDGKLSVSTRQKETNKFTYIPLRSDQCQTIKNYVWGEISAMLHIIRKSRTSSSLKHGFRKYVLTKGFRKLVLTILFQCVTYAQRNKLLKMAPLTSLSAPHSPKNREENFHGRRGSILWDGRTSNSPSEDPTKEWISHQTGIISTESTDGLLSSFLALLAEIVESLQLFSQLKVFISLPPTLTFQENSRDAVWFCQTSYRKRKKKLISEWKT